MFRYTYPERQAARIIFVTGLLLGIGLVLAFLGSISWLFPLASVVLVVGVHVLSSRKRALDFDTWLRGASGESLVRNALKELEPLGYVLLDDVHTGLGNIDHVVVGPTGVFAVETKNPRAGRVRSNGGSLFLDDRPVEDHRQAVRGAMWVRRHSTTGFVQALLVYPNAAVDGNVIRLSNVTVLGLSRLNDEIKSKRSPLAVTEIEAIVQEVRSAAISVALPR